MSPTDDVALLQAWRGGDGRAGDTLVAKHYHGVLRFFELRTRSAEDLTQRTFLACVEGRDRIKLANGFRAYLYGIARYQLLQHLSDANRLARLSSFDEEPAATGAGLTTFVAKKEEQRLLLQALVELPPDTQILFGLYYWEGLMAKEIAAVLEVSQSTLSSRLARGRDQLRAVVEKLGGSHGVAARVEVDFEAWMRSLANDASTAEHPAIPTLAAALRRSR
ncbi:MAG: RNA polymerase sigma factor [Nannocystaceae bacterium]|nr:sigma-70 family RNA polymerase sigma factor [bacterium]